QDETRLRFTALMTLSRKILLRTTAIFALLLLLGAVSLAGMLMLWGSVQTASNEYEELRLIESTEKAVLRADSLLRTAPADVSAVLAEVETGIAAMEEFESIQLTDLDEGTSSHEQRETEAVKMALSQLREIA